MSDPLFEDDVVNAVREHLAEEGFNIKSVATARQRGDDIIAVSETGKTKVYVEAKGATSSREGSKRFGESFSRSQVKDHVAKAFYRAAKMRKNRDGEAIQVGMALPRNDDHLEMVDKIAISLSDLEIEVFWVDQGKNVTAVGNW